ncbi:MAG: KpsF/GutQ family sugar-phosphate isomerase [Alphaproteobacteria bacterium]|nr:KpsF/GutQ family sugar-phosphate isomerase [Alphaproteobacteria bacterium]
MSVPRPKEISLSARRAADARAARRVIHFAGEALTALGENLDGAFSDALDLLVAVRGRVVVSGMGKSGHVGRKIAATLSSTGTPAQFVHPAEASHGDLGSLTRSDALLMLSNSGDTEELADLITYAKRFAIPLIGVASNAESALIAAADVALVLPKVQEACPMGLAPTTSTTLMLVLGDALAVALMERRGFSTDQYRDLHPAGALSRALIRVSDIMHSGEELPLVTPEIVMRDVLIAMTAGGFGIAGVVDGEGALIGIITDGDLRRHMEPELLTRKAREVMTSSPKTVPPDMLAAEALAVMNGTPKVTCLFIVEADAASRRPVGILHVHDCLRAGLR